MCVCVFACVWFGLVLLHINPCNTESFFIHINNSISNSLT